jgi:hypothetical protein
LTTVLQRLLNHAGIDLERWGQANKIQDPSDLALLAAYQAPHYLAEALKGALDPYYSQLLQVVAPSATRLERLMLGDRLSLTSTEDLKLYLRFALASIPNRFATDGDSSDSQPLRFSGEGEHSGRLPIETEQQRRHLSEALNALGVDRLAERLALVIGHYQQGIKSIEDPRLIPALLAQTKTTILSPGSGIIDRAIASDLPDPQLQKLETLHQVSLDSLYEPKVHDERRFVALTGEEITDLDSSGTPIHKDIIAVSLSAPAPAGGVIVPLGISGSATYGHDFAFEGEATFPEYVYVPFGESRVLLTFDSAVQAPKAFSAVLSILDPSSSYSRSKDMDRVYIVGGDKKSGSAEEIKIYDNDKLVRLNTSPDEPESFYSPSAFDTSFDYNFYKDSSVVGIESDSDHKGKPLRLYAHSSLPGVRRYAFSDPEKHPWGGEWLLLDDDVIMVEPGDNGQVPIREFYSSKLGDYYYTTANNHDSRFLTEEWLDLGIQFSLRNFSPTTGYSLGTLRSRISSNLTFATYPSRDSLNVTERAMVAAMGFKPEQISDTQYIYDIDTRPTNLTSNNAPLRPRYSVTFDTASFAGSLWNQDSGIDPTKVPSAIYLKQDQVSPFNYNPITRSGARFYTIGSHNYDTIDFSGDTESITNADALSRMTIALADRQIALTAATDRFAITPFNADSSAANPQLSFNIDLSFSLQLADSTKLSFLEDMGFYLLPQGVAGLESPSSSPSRELLQQYGLQLFQTSTAFDSFLDPSASNPLFKTNLQLPTSTSYLLVAMDGSSPYGQVLKTELSLSSSANVLHFDVPGTGTLNVSIAASPAALDDYLARDQGVVPALNLLGLTQPVSLSFDLSREAQLNNTVGLYRAIDLDGGVRDPLTGDIRYPGDQFYAIAALSVANTRDLPGDLLVQGDRGSARETRTLFEDAVLFPYARSSAGETYFAFANANADRISHFRVLGRNVFGYEDLQALESDFDFDDTIITMNAQFF